MAYEPSLSVLYEQAARSVDRILRGTKSAGLPVEQSTHFQLAINMKTAKALGLTVPPSLLARADEVIQYLCLRLRRGSSVRGWGLTAAMGTVGAQRGSEGRGRSC